MFLLTVMQHTNMLRRLCVALVVGGEEKYGKTCEIFKERPQQELYHCENNSPPPTLNFHRKHGTEIFFLVMRISSVPNFFKSFPFGTFWHRK